MKCFMAISRQKGVGLIEVLIAVLVLGVGILGAMVLQSNALKNNQSSLARTQAVVLSYAMLDALRINRVDALKGNYDMDKTCTPPSGNTLIANDQAYWIGALQEGLGGKLSTGEIGAGNASTTCGEIDCDSAGFCTIKVYWDDERGTSGEDNQVIETSTQI